MLIEGRRPVEVRLHLSCSAIDILRLDRIHDRGVFGQGNVFVARPDQEIGVETKQPAKHGLADLVIDGETVSPFHVQSATAPFSLTGLPALSMRFGTSHDGIPIGVQIVSSWLAESTVLKVASFLEEVSPVRNLHPALQPQQAELPAAHLPAI